MAAMGWVKGLSRCEAMVFDQDFHLGLRMPLLLNTCDYCLAYRVLKNLETSVIVIGFLA